jgi:hypothetical protein
MSPAAERAVEIDPIGKGLQIVEDGIDEDRGVEFIEYQDLEFIGF